MKKSPFYIIIFLFFSACVSVQMPTSKGQKSKFVSFQAPSKPFQSVENKMMDSVWINEKNGNTISYLSECEAKIEPTLEQLENDTLLSLQTVTSKTSEKINFSQRAALESNILGTLDGVSVKIKQVSVFKNNCSYVISYLGVENKYSEDLNKFVSFLKDFKIQ